MTEPTRYTYQQILSDQLAADDRLRAGVERAVALALYEKLPRPAGKLLRMEMSFRLAWLVTPRLTWLPEGPTEKPWTAGQPIPEWADLPCRGDLTVYPLDVAG